MPKNAIVRSFSKAAGVYCPRLCIKINAHLLRGYEKIINFTECLLTRVASLILRKLRLMGAPIHLSADVSLHHRRGTPVDHVAAGISFA
jgi:hypothetical protein